MTDMDLLAIRRGKLFNLWQKDPDLGLRMFMSIADSMANRYRSTLSHLTTQTAQALKATDFWAYV